MLPLLSMEETWLRTVQAAEIVMNREARLDALNEIQLLVYRWFTAIDMQDWGAFDAGIADDILIDNSGVARRIITSESGIYRGRSEVIAWAKRCTDGAVSVHQVMMPQIELLSESSAKGVWTLEDRVHWPEETPVRRLHGHGHIHDTYTRVDGAWKLGSQRLTRIHVEKTGPWDRLS